MITGSTSNIPPGALDWGDLRRMDPVSDRWGYDRGLPVDRYYIEAFLRRTAATSVAAASRYSTPTIYGGSAAIRSPSSTWSTSIPPTSRPPSSPT